MKKFKYILAINEGDLVDAETLSDDFGNPNGIENYFLKFPRVIGTRGYEYPDPIEWYVSSVVAYDLISEGVPSREALDQATSLIPGLLWWRSTNDQDAFIIQDKHNLAAGNIGEEWSIKQAVESLGFSY